VYNLMLHTPPLQMPLGIEPVVAPRPALTASDTRPCLIGLDRAAIAEALGDIVPERQRKMRAQQLWQWIYQRGAQSFDEMTSISRDLHAVLAAHLDISRPQVVERHVSSDGTRKWLLRFPDGNEVETVFIPEDDRGTLCVSSQVGCTLTCRF